MATKKVSVCLVKFLELFLWCTIHILVLVILHFVGKGAASLLDRLGWRWLEGIFLSFISAFLGFMGLPLYAEGLMWSYQVIGL
jgi:hypothetical protein